jgi:hypothetical protein
LIFTKIIPVIIFVKPFQYKYIILFYLKYFIIIIIIIIIEYLRFVILFFFFYSITMLDDNKYRINRRTIWWGTRIDRYYWKLINRWNSENPDVSVFLVNKGDFMIKIRGVALKQVDLCGYLIYFENGYSNFSRDSFYFYVA